MIIKDDFIVSPSYELLRTILVRCEIGDDDFELRIELFQVVTETGDESEDRSYMFQLWRSESVELVPSFDNPGNEVFTHSIYRKWTSFVGIGPEESVLSAKSSDEALAYIRDLLLRYFKKCRGSHA